MGASRVPIIRRTTYDFGELVSEGTQSLVLRRSIPAPCSRGTLMVRVHAVDVGAGSDGDITVSVRADGVTADDPAQLFFGDPPLAEVIAAADGATAPRYLVQTFAVKSDHLVVQLDATQASNNVGGLSARLSVDLLLDDGPLSEDAWTPAALSPEGWWCADLGHALADQDPVASWANQGTAGTAGDVGQGTSSRQPIYVESHASFNGRAVLDFDGDDVLCAAAGTWWEQTADGESLTVIGVARVTTSASAQHSVSAISGFATLGGYQLAINPGGNGR